MKKIQVYKGKESFFWGTLIREDDVSFYVYMEDNKQIPIKFPKGAYSYKLLEVK